jgi:rhodanese-related sulfurtransferase
MTPDALRQKLSSGEPIRIIDIRSAEEYRSEHIPHSLSVPLGALGGFTPEKDESVVIVFSEQDPQVFEAVRNILDQKSFAYFFIRGGFEAWKTGGYQTISLGDPNSFVDQSKVTYLSGEDLKKLLADASIRTFLLDVQSTENFNKNHIRGAVNIPLNQLEKRADEIPSARPIVVYGEHELASFQGGVRLFDLNIFTAKTLAGNDIFTLASGLPLEKQP